MKVASYRLGQYDKETGTLIEGPMKDHQTGKYLEFHDIEESNRYLKEHFKDEPENMFLFLNRIFITITMTKLQRRQLRFLVRRNNIMTMLELQKVLGDEMNKLIAGTTQPENAKAAALLAKQMINNADIILRADKFTNQDGSRINQIVGDADAKATSVD